jgi:hypothetical protein
LDICFADHPENIHDMADLLLCALSTDQYNENVFTKNFTRNIVQLLFIAAIKSDSAQDLALMKKAMLESLYSTFKA